MAPFRLKSWSHYFKSFWGTFGDLSGSKVLQDRIETFLTPAGPIQGFQSGCFHTLNGPSVDCCVSASQAIIRRRSTSCSKTKCSPLKRSETCNPLKRVDAARFHLVQVANKSKGFFRMKGQHTSWMNSGPSHFIVIYLLNFYAAHLPYKGTLGSLQVTFKHFGDLSQLSCFKGKTEKEQFQEPCFLSLLWHKSTKFWLCQWRALMLLFLNPEAKMR